MTSNIEDFILQIVLKDGTFIIVIIKENRTMLVWVLFPTPTVCYQLYEVIVEGNHWEDF